MVKTLVRNRIVLVWMALVAATLASWTLGVGHGLPPTYAAITIIVIALVKVYFVGDHFMELRHAPTALRAVFGGWLAAVGCTLVGLYVFA